MNTGSLSSLFVRNGRNQGAYAMTKYAVLALSEALEQELKGSSIGVSILCPGGVTTSIGTNSRATCSTESSTSIAAGESRSNPNASNGRR